jgi:hypothetical protein
MSEDLTPEGIEKEAAMERSYRVKFKAINPGKLNRLNKADRLIMMANIEEHLLDFETLQSWKKNPDIYSSLVTAGVFSLIKRNFAPLEQRMNSVIAREERIPVILEQAKKNLMPDHIPKVFAEINLEQMDGTIDFFQETLPDTFKTVTNETLRQEFGTTNLAVINALKDYQKFVSELVSKNECKGDFKLGPDNYAKKLLYAEMVDTPLEKLLADGYDELHKQQKLFKDLSEKVSPNQTTEQYFTSISSDHPKPDELIQSVQGVLDEVRTYCVDKNICTRPSQEQAKVAETPPFDRALTIASMDTPGPYETTAKEAYYYVTLPEQGWSAKKTEEHMRSFSYPDIINTSVHECYPGHYVQFLWSKQYPSKTRKLTSANTNVEGWAHYCEQMMLDEGLRGNDSKLHMMQLHDALLRCCRYIAALEMHTKSWSVDDAIQFFMKEGYMEKANAEREAKRGTMDPLYLEYTLGKVRILALRDDYKKAKGESFNLKDFHDRFLKCGPIPLKLVRSELLNQPVPDAI